MAIFRGTGGSLDGLVESEVILLAISQGGTGSATAAGARTNLGLGTAAATDTSAYATAAQGAKADTAIQSADLATVATTGDYDDLTDKPTLGTAAAEDVGYFATAAQGTLADSAVQPGDLATVATSGSYNDLTDKPSAGSGTVTSVAMSVPTGLSVSGSPVTTTGTLAVTYSAGYAIPTTAKQTEWDTAYGWGNHASAGYLTSETYTGTVTSVAMSVPTGLSVSGTPITGAGTLAVTLTSGYSIPTTSSQTNWDTAYGWGNHASAGYALDSAVVHNTGTETVAGAKTFSTSVTSPIITASTKFVSSYFDASGSGGGSLRNASGTAQLQWGGGGGNNITFDVAANLNPANSQIDISPTGTGTVRINPATLSSMNNVTIGATTAAAITGTTITATTYAGGNTSNWNTAFGWGNHASAGYLTSSSTLDASKLSGTIDGGTY
jgi:hypothetical protein